MSDKNMIEIHTASVNQRLDRVENTMGKIFDKLDESAQILAKLTVIVEEHQKRSNTLEKMFHVMRDSFAKLHLDWVRLAQDHSDLKDEIIPIKDHVNKVSKVVNFLSGVPTVVKGVVLVFTLVTSSYGAFAIIKMLIAK